jgi:hypothetical protein
MPDLVLAVKREYFEQMRDRTKLAEYRLVTPFWKKRLEGRPYANVVITLGYPKKGDLDRTLVFPYRGYKEEVLQHPHFGSSPVRVFAIPVIY